MRDVSTTPKPQPSAAVWPLVLMVLALFGLLLFAGVPEDDHVAGDGSDALRHGWARELQRAADAQAAPAPATPSTDAPR